MRFSTRTDINHRRWRQRSRRYCRWGVRRRSSCKLFIKTFLFAPLTARTQPWASSDATNTHLQKGYEKHDTDAFRPALNIWVICWLFGARRRDVLDEAYCKCPGCDVFPLGAFQSPPPPWSHQLCSASTPSAALLIAFHMHHYTPRINKKNKLFHIQCCENMGCGGGVGCST